MYHVATHSLTHSLTHSFTTLPYPLTLLDAFHSLCVLRGRVLQAARDGVPVEGHRLQYGQARGSGDVPRGALRLTHVRGECGARVHDPGGEYWV